MGGAGVPTLGSSGFHPTSPKLQLFPQPPGRLPLNSRLGDHPPSHTLTRVGGTSQLLGRGQCQPAKEGGEPSGFQGPRPPLERGTGRRSTAPAAGREACPTLVFTAHTRADHGDAGLHGAGHWPGRGPGSGGVGTGTTALATPVSQGPCAQPGAHLPPLCQGEPAGSGRALCPGQGDWHLHW